LVRVAQLRAMLAGRVVCNVSSSSVGGGVAEMVRSLLAYARGAGVDTRWMILEAPPPFFRITKRLHNAIHGSAGDGSPLGDDERRVYEAVAAENAAHLAAMVRAGDVVIVHDPQPAGMIPVLVRTGARVVWRCHIGHDRVDEEVERGWRFLLPYVAPADAYVFTRAAYVPAALAAARAAIIPPSLDPFSAKNQPLTEEAVRAILRRTGICEAPATGAEASLFVREDGTPGRVDRAAEVLRDGPAATWETPLVVQVSRWDRLKDFVGVMHGFTRIDAAALHGAVLLLAGPSARSVSDDPEGAAVFEETVAAWRELPDEARRRVQLVELPTADVDENGAIVNALQRHATVIVQKSLHEGFGLTVTEAMWKGRPVVASAVGGIRDQLDDGAQGLLLADPRDLDGLAAALARLLGDPALCRRMGEAGQARVRDRYLGIDSLLRYGGLIERLDAAALTPEAPAAR
ncbi:MAG TPA: glycosyltransferase, partial [Ideonella sp.]|nr:glycosyltransferase [Ideonella sp.]